MVCVQTQLEQSSLQMGIRLQSQFSSSDRFSIAKSYSKPTLTLYPNAAKEEEEEEEEQCDEQEYDIHSGVARHTVFVSGKTNERSRKAYSLKNAAAAAAAADDDEDV